MANYYDYDMITPIVGENHDGFYLETHLHTSNASACSSMTATDMVKMYKKAGYDGVIITDHFLTGNTSVNRELSWKEQVRDFFKGVDEALVAGEEYGLRVFEGLEYSNHGTDFIVLGLSREWISNNPSMKYMDPEEFLPMFREAGAFIIQAHPFREADYVREVRAYPELVDALEVVNLGNRQKIFNDRALELAKKCGKPMTAGSDCHHFGNINFGAGICIDHEPKDLEEICSIIKSGKGYSIFGEDHCALR